MGILLTTSGLKHGALYKMNKPELYLVSGGDVIGKPRRHAITERSRLECTLLVSITWQGTPIPIGLVNIADDMVNSVPV